MYSVFVKKFKFAFIASIIFWVMNLVSIVAATTQIFFIVSDIATVLWLPDALDSLIFIWVSFAWVAALGVGLNVWLRVSNALYERVFTRLGYLS